MVQFCCPVSKLLDKSLVALVHPHHLLNWRTGVCVNNFGVAIYCFLDLRSITTTIYLTSTKLEKGLQGKLCSYKGLSIDWSWLRMSHSQQSLVVWSGKKFILNTPQTMSQLSVWLILMSQELIKFKIVCLLSSFIT